MSRSYSHIAKILNDVWPNKSIRGNQMTPAGKARLILDEGIAYKDGNSYLVYNDLNGLPIKPSEIGGYATIGIGRNLYSKGITLAEAEYLLDNDLAEIETNVQSIAGYSTFPDVWKDVVVMIEFNTGNVRSFPRMLKAMAFRDEKTAAANCTVTNKALTARYARMAKAIINNTW